MGEESKKIKGECPRCEHLDVYYEESIGRKFYCDKCYLHTILLAHGLESLDKKYKK